MDPERTDIFLSIGSIRFPDSCGFEMMEDDPLKVFKKAVDNGWVKRVGTEKEGGNPERYIYQIMPAGRKYYKKMLKQYFDHTMIHFDIDIVLMFYNSLMPEQKEAFIEDRMEAVKEKLVNIKEKVDEEMKLPEEKSHIHVFTYLENHLKAELSWLKTLKKGDLVSSDMEA